MGIRIIRSSLQYFLKKEYLTSYKCNKTIIMEFHFKPRKDILIIYSCDPNDINTMTYKQVQDF